MPILVRCNCGKNLQVPDTAAGSRIRCGNCQTVLTVPAAADVPVVPAADSRLTSSARPPRPKPGREVDADAAAQRPKPARSSSGSSMVWIFVLLGVGGVVLLGCLTIGGIAAYFAFSGSSSESQLIGEWEMDPEPWQKTADKAPAGGVFMPDIKLTFNKDHTFKLVMLVEMNGRWQVVSRSGNQWRVKMTMQTFGIDQSNPPTATITIVDKDHIEFNSNQQSMQLAGLFRRVGTGPPVASIPVGPQAAGGSKPATGQPPINRGAPTPGLDAGMKPDCEVEWGGTWFPAKILKTEKDRWFIHYVGWPSNWDEWVDKNRIRFKK